ncbi:MAG: peptidoglycan DD-metalloendopeptidase family protein [Clostridia bacterium]|nr:peptidoglycan DD-metalloendopeptidase family protein [Clostridia bacterium]
MKKLFVKILGTLISITLVMQCLNVYALTEKEELENEKKEINKQLEDAKKKQEEVEAQKSKTMKEVESLIGQIAEYETEINSLETRIKELKSQIKTKEKDIEQKEIEYTEQEELLEDRLVSIYKNGDMSYLDVLLTSSSLTDFFGKYYSATQLVECDKDLIQSTKEQKAKIEQEKAELESNKKELDTALAQSEQKNIKLKDIKQQKQVQAAKLTEEEQKLQKEIEEFEEANRKIAQEIKQAEIRYQKQLEELRKKAEEEAQKNNNNNGSGNNTTTGSGYFMRPVATGKITATSHYSSGKFHGAIDYGVPVGTPVVAAADGVVMYTANLSGSYGTYVVIRHANGLQSYYGHGTYGSISVKGGAIVKKGEKIMLSGNTGNSSGPHLHFEVRKSPYNYSYNATGYGGDSRVNPLNYL